MLARLEKDAQRMTPELFASALKFVLLALAGAAFGFGYFTALGRTVAVFSANPGRLLRPAALTAARLAAALVFFGLAARLGAEALLGAFLGFLAGRSAVLRFKGRAG
jgi:hypothetical protein